MRLTVIPIVLYALKTVLNGLQKGTEGTGNQLKNRKQPGYIIVEISQNTEKSSGDLMRFGITQTPVLSLKVILG